MGEKVICSNFEQIIIDDGTSIRRYRIDFHLCLYWTLDTHFSELWSDFKINRPAVYTNAFSTCFIDHLPFITLNQYYVRRIGSAWCTAMMHIKRINWLKEIKCDNAIYYMYCMLLNHNVLLIYGRMIIIIIIEQNG